MPTRRDVLTPLTAELAAAGFEDAVEIGHGGFGVVYRCWQEALDRTVAVKVSATELDPDDQARFIREQHAMGRLTEHPNIVTVLEVGATASGHAYLVMPYYQPDSLDAWIRKHGPTSLGKGLSIGVKIAGALESAHRLGIMHRDVKPGNILFTNYGEPALTDFGIAHIAGGFRTSAGTLTGSPAFIAPEVLEGEAPTPAADVYGLGATLFCAITGHAAFERRAEENVVTQFLRITTQPVSGLRDSGIPDDVIALIATAMHREVGHRPSAAVLGDTIRQIQRRHEFPIDEMALRIGPELGPLDQRSRVRTQFPSAAVARGPDRGDGNLPYELTSFIDRRTELAEMKRELSVSRLVTLTGSGGVGKTRLALRAASTARHNFADGAWLVELADVSDASHLVEVVAATLDIRGRPNTPLVEVLTQFLGSADMLLILDNCEHVVDAVAKLTDTMLRACPHLRILATSREPLNIDGESVVWVPPLAVPNKDQESNLRAISGFGAVTLFSDRAAAVVPGFQLDGDNTSAVAQICARLDGLPLAIELAAAWLRSMSIDQILQHLDDRYSFLTHGSRSAPKRQQALQWCIDWSYELCTLAEQRLWARLSVFVGGFELDAAEDICATDLTPPSALDALTSLVDKSILIREEVDTVVRFRMLETLRQYGRQKLQTTAEYEALRRRHRGWYKQLALDAEAEWISHRQPEWVARLDREQPNLREALESFLSEDTPEAVQASLRTSAALYEFWFLRGLYGEGRALLDRALARSDAGPAPDRVAALRASIQLAAVHGDFRTVATHSKEVRALSQQSSIPAVQAQIDIAEGSLALTRGDAARACAALERAVNILRTQRTSTLHANALGFLMWASEVRGDRTRTDTHSRELLSVTEPCGELFYRGSALRGMAVVAWQQGDRRRAEHLIMTALRLNRRLNSPTTAAVDFQALAWTIAHTDAERAAVLMGAAARLWPAAREATTAVPPLSPLTSPLNRECDRVTRRALGARKFDAAFRRGRMLSLDAAVAYALGEQGSTPSRGTSTALTKRERQVAELIGQGLSNKQIAAKLVISQRTAEGHVEHILTKLAFTSRAQIAVWVTIEDAHAP